MPNHVARAGVGPVGPVCPNCDAALPSDPAPSYCWRCGQETTLHEPSLLEFVHEFAGHYVAIEGALWRTLKTLVTAPGRLTREYFAGRRRHYVLPLRLYLSASFVFFLVVKVFGAGGGLQIVVAPGIDSHGRPITAARDPAAYAAALRDMQHCVDLPGSCSWLTTQGASYGLKAAALSDRPQQLVARMLPLAPYVVFALLPLFAAFVAVAWRARRIGYGGHFVFSLHTHAFWFLALTLLALLPAAAGDLAFIVLPGYALLALHRVYGGRWWATLLRGAAVAIVHFVALTLAISALAVASLAGGAS